MSSLQSSKEYHRFLSPVIQRPIVVPNVEAIKASFADRQRRGLEPFDKTQPISVRQEGSRYRIIRGQHRHFAAQEFGCALYFIADASLRDEDTIDRHRGHWTPIQLTSARANEGNPGYKFLLDFVQRHRVPVATAYILLGSNGIEFDNGTFVPNAEGIEFAEKVMEVVNAARKYVSWGSHGSFIRCVAAAIRAPGVVHSKLAKKILTYPNLLERKSSVNDYAQVLENIYNYRSESSERVNIAFLVKESAKSGKIQNLARARGLRNDVKGTSKREANSLIAKAKSGLGELFN